MTGCDARMSTTGSARGGAAAGAGAGVGDLVPVFDLGAILMEGGVRWSRTGSSMWTGEFVAVLRFQLARRGAGAYSQQR